ncbi:MAG: hypothetical protein PHO08_15280 [Methylococcales bacterium]|nr:hypothetical protein [Methylococcales bacterium]
MLGIPITDFLVSPEKRIVDSNGSTSTAVERQGLALFEEIIFLAFNSIIWHHLGVTISINGYLFY